MSEPLRVILKHGRNKPVWLGHPWIFGGAVDRVEGEVGPTGGPCVVEDPRGHELGSGYYNPHGAIRVRVLQHRRSTDRAFEPRPVAEVVRERIVAAVARRRPHGVPGDELSAYRVVNAEGDKLPGLEVDRLGPVAAVYVSSRQMYEVREVVAEALQEQLPVEAVVQIVDAEASRMEVLPAGTETLAGTPPEEVEAVEGPVAYRLQPGRSPRTELHTARRPSRRAFAELCPGHEVLDLFTHVGGFGLHAARAGAAGTTAVDVSGPLVSAAATNVAHNGLEDRVEVVRSDAMTWLKEAHAAGRRWGRIVCDPPAFAGGRRHADEALKKYARLNTLAISALEPRDGLLLTCTSSRHVSQTDFLRMLTDAGHRLRRTVHVHAVWGQGPDHPFPVVAPEGRAFTAVLLGTSPD